MLGLAVSAAARARRRGRLDAERAYRTGQSPHQVETVLTATAVSLPSEQVGAYLDGGRSVRPQDLGESVRARVAAGDTTDPRARWAERGQSLGRGMELADVVHVGLVVWIASALVIVIAVAQARPVSAVVVVACVAIAWTAGWWAPRRRHHARLRYLDEMATPYREHRREAARYQLRWTLISTACVVGGLLAELWLLRQVI